MALLGQQLEDTSRGLLDELEAARVVGEGDVREHDLFDAVLQEKNYNTCFQYFTLMVQLKHLSVNLQHSNSALSHESYS